MCERGKKEKKKRPNVIHFEAYWSHFNTHSHSHTKQSASCQPRRERIEKGSVDVAVAVQKGGRTTRLWTTMCRGRVRGVSEREREEEGVTRGVLHYRGRDGIPGDMGTGRGFTRRRAVWLWFRNHYARGAKRRRQTGEGVTRTKMADTRA